MRFCSPCSFFWVESLIRNATKYDLEPAREAEANVDLAPVTEPEADDDLIILEEVNSGESGVMVAAPSQTEVKKTKKKEATSHNWLLS